MDEIELTKKLIEIESVSGNETKILEFIADFLQKKSAYNFRNPADFTNGKCAGNGQRVKRWRYYPCRWR